MGARICVSIRETTTHAAAAAAARAAEWADLVEIRGDFIRDLDLNLNVLFRSRPRPVIFTLRSREEGGEYGGSERKRLETILRAANSGADYVDIEFSAAWPLILQSIPPERVVLSSHNMEETPAGLPERMRAMAASRAGILKIAVRARALADNLRVAELLAMAREQGINLCALAMGSEGAPSRILGPCWGSWMTFASMPGGEATADGQLPADVLVNQLRVRDLTHETLLYSVLGNPLRHSLSPLIHNAAFAARGMNAVLLPLQAAGFDDFLQFQSAFPMQGVAVTIPFKQDAYALAHSLSVAAERTGAVNTLIAKEGGWHGENTDVEGFLRPLKRRIRPARLRSVVLGTGGAARAVAYGLRQEGSDVCVVGRDEDRARELAHALQVNHAGWDQLQNLHWDLLVNATPLGMFPDIDRSPIPATLLGGGWVYDLVYNPAMTRLLKDALQRGCTIIRGSEMFLGQAWKQQFLWCGSPPPEHVMEAALESRLAKKADPHDRAE